MPAEIVPNPVAVSLGEIWRNICTDNGSLPSMTIADLDEILHVFEHGLFRKAAGVYGYAADGLCNFIAAGSATVAGATLSSGTYTMTRDIYLSSGSIVQAGATITTAGFRIFCNGLLTVNGTIDSSGNAASADTAGAALAYSGTISNTTVGEAGGAGSTTENAGTAAATNALGGVGGAGGVGAGPQAGGLGGAVTGPAVTVQGPYTVDLAAKVRVVGTTALALCLGGAGGGSGGGDGTNLSGGGGGGGGIVMVAARSLAGTGTISAKGGAGGAAAVAGNSAGGGGGGGGCIIIISSSVNPLAISGAASALINGPTLSVAGGAGGAKTGTGTVGLVGLAGTTILIPH